MAEFCLETKISKSIYVHVEVDLNIHFRAKIGSARTNILQDVYYT